MSEIERQHLQRKAYVYVRQSTMAQVEHNTESLERQYELSERAVALTSTPTSAAQGRAPTGATASRG